MKIDIISDLHIDFYMPAQKVFKATRAKNLFDKIFKDTPSDTLVIAGDIGHYNLQNYESIRYLSEHYYKNVIVVLGNHDYYLLNPSQAKKYNNNSFSRVEELRGMLNSIENVYCLDGNVVEIDGIKFGGCDSWYDGSYYYYLQSGYGGDIFSYWQHSMNDASKILGIEDFYEILKIEKEKLDKVYQNCDVLVTHVSPSSHEEDLPEYKQGQLITGFYAFDGDMYLERTTAKYWIFGHMHNGIDYEREGVKCLTSALGYPNQKKKFTVRTVDISLEGS